MVSSITDVPGIRVGQAEDVEALTGCTVVLCDEGTVAGVDQRGGAPGTRETDLLQPMHMVEHVHAVMLAGGSAYGLDAASGVMKFLEENEVGFDTGYAKVPVVPGAILFDLGLGSAIVRPDAEMGYKACQNATKNAPSEGNHGAGTGASVGKILGMANAVKSGIGSSCIALSDDVFVGALIAVNAIGDILDPYSGELLAGPRGESGTSFLSTTDILKSMLGANPQSPVASHNTVIGVVATNATLSKEAANKVAQMAHNGFARAIRPAHSMFDGDTIFSLATCKHPAGKSPTDISLIGQAAADAAAKAIVSGLRHAEKAGGLPSIHDL